MEKDSDVKATMRISEAADEKSLIKDKFFGQPVKIIFFNPPIDDIKPNNQHMKFLLSAYDWNGYPNTVAVGFGGYKNTYVETLAYKVGAKGNDLLILDFNANGKFHERWICKNKENNVAGIMLKPFALIYDIATFPLLAVLMAFSYSL